MGLWQRLSGRADAAEAAPEPAQLAPAVVSLHRGPFVHAQCVHCGWEGPGRRSYGAMNRDFHGHAETCAEQHRAEATA